MFDDTARRRPYPRRTPYALRMAITAQDVAAEIRRRMPGVPTLKLHKLLYYCQGHHLAAFAEPLFAELVSAWDKGPVVGELWHAEQHGVEPPGAAPLDEAELNTIGYVVSRYGALTGNDLIHLTHAETPWQRADESRAPGGSSRIEQGWMADYFASDGAGDVADDVPFDQAELSAILADAPVRREQQVTRDTRESLAARLHR